MQYPRSSLHDRGQLVRQLHGKANQTRTDISIYLYRVLATPVHSSTTTPCNADVELVVPEDDRSASLY
jgi:hypothetical protein